MLTRILFVDDEPNILSALERQFRKQFDIQTAVGAELGLEAIGGSGPFAVVVSDLRMPGMNGIEFLARVREISPNSVRVMLSGQADFDAAIAAVNEGHIFQFLTKPCPFDKMARVLTAALEQYRLITAEKELLEQTLRSSIGVLSEILSLVNPAAFGRAQRIRRFVVQMADRLALADRWQFELAAMLSQIGSVTVPPELMEKQLRKEALTPQESQILAAQSHVGSDLLAHIPRLETVAQMVSLQHALWNHGAGKLTAGAIGGQLLKVASDFDEQMMQGADAGTVLAVMHRNADYNPAFVAVLQKVQAEESLRSVRDVTVAQLRAKMVMHEDVRGRNGMLLFAKGQEVTASAIARLRSIAHTGGLVEPLRVDCYLGLEPQTQAPSQLRQEAFFASASILR